MYTANPEISTEYRLQGRALTIARLVWAVIFLFSVGVFLAALPARDAQLRSSEDEIREGMARLGFSPEIIEQYGSEAAMRAIISQLGLSEAGFAIFILVLEGMVALVYIIIALLIFWRKSDHLMGLLASLFLVTFGVAGSSYLLIPLQMQDPVGFYLVAAVAMLAFSLLPPFFYLFPDGWLVPRWAWIPAGFWAITTFFWNFVPRSPLNPTRWPLGPFFLYLLLLWGSAVAAQIYRYRRISNIAQRQQTKWVVFGFALMVLLLLPPFMILPYQFTGIAPEVIYSILAPLQTLAMSIIPITLAISILRYRLWDIDLIIRRTLQYTLLTGLLLVIYFGSIVLLQTLVENLTGQQSPIVVVVSTLAIAALFNPLRLRIQDFIDRRFYRKKYDAEQALAQFAATARDEVDMEKLMGTLLQVVEETVQPEVVGLWLKSDPKSPSRGS